MIDAVFISDLHLHPEDKAIESRFNAFITWAEASVKKIYILGDFFHVWPGDDAIDSWSRGIAQKLKGLTKKGITLYFMHGNRDFLLGEQFAKEAGWIVLPDPSVINLDGQSVLLAHGDSYCTLDKKHQYFRRLTRSKIFYSVFMGLPLVYRQALVNKVRAISQNQTTKTLNEMDVVEASLVKHMFLHETLILIHGHTHRPGLSVHHSLRGDLLRYVLSDWDDSPKILCYNCFEGFYYEQTDSWSDSCLTRKIT